MASRHDIDMLKRTLKNALSDMRGPKEVKDAALAYLNSLDLNTWIKLVDSDKSRRFDHNEFCAATILSQNGFVFDEAANSIEFAK